MSKKSKEVAVKETTAVSTEVSGMFDMSLESAGDTLDAKDLRISKLTLIQQMTKKSYNTEKAPEGNYIDSIEKTDLGNSVDLFIMSDTSLWEVKFLPKGATQKEYLATIDYTPANKDLRTNPRMLPEFAQRAEKLGVDLDMLKAGEINEIKRFYVVKVEDVMAGSAFPFIIDFKRSSYPAGIHLKNVFYRMRTQERLPSYAKVFTLSSEMETKDNNEFYVKKVSAGRMITPDEVKAVEQWVREMMNNRDAYTDDESDEGEAFVQAEATVVSEAGQPKF